MFMMAIARFLRSERLNTKFKPILEHHARFGSSTECCMGPQKRTLEGKVAIVTASTFGIGFAIVKKMIQDGAKVMISSRKETHVKKAVDEIRLLGIPKDNVHGVVCHVGDKEQRQRLIAETVSKFGGQISTLVSNAAVNPHVGHALECPESKWDKIMDVNLKAPYMLTQELYPYLQKAKGSSVIYISSIAGFIGLKEIGAYSVSKSGLLGLTKTLANQLAAENIRVNCVVPGVIQTKFSSVMQHIPDGTIPNSSIIPMGRYGTPDEIAGLVAFLASDEASYITGENIVVAGGICTRL